MNYLANIVQRYESALGLEFKPSGNQVECIFTRIDPSDASRKFIFTLSLSLDDKYKSNDLIKKILASKYLPFFIFSWGSIACCQRKGIKTPRRQSEQNQ